MARPVVLAPAPDGALQRALVWGRTLRLGEVTLMTGYPAAAALYGLDRGELPRPELAWALGGLFLLALAIYTFNSVGGVSSDRHDAKFSASALHTGEASAAGLLVLAGASFALALLVLGLGAPSLTLTAALLGLLWLAYSLPRGLKGVPLAGVGVHLVSGAVLFAAPYALHRPLGAHCAWLAAAFALAFASGHANHELIDRATDLRAGIRTTAVALGPLRAHRLGLLWAVLGYAAIAAGLGWGQLALSEAVPFLLVAPLHLGLGLAAASSVPDGAAARRYRTGYRLLFAAAVAASLTPRLAALAGRLV